MSELYGAIGELRGEHDARLDRLEQLVTAIAELPVEIARAQASALIGLLKTKKEAGSSGDDA